MPEQRIMWSRPQVRNIIYENGNMFRRGAEFSDTEMLALFDETMPVFTEFTDEAIRVAANKIQCTKLKYQVKINKILALRGLYMKQTGTVGYQILSRAEVPRQVASFSEASTAKAERATTLATGFQRHQARLYPRISNRELGN